MNTILDADNIIAQLKSLANPENVKGMARYGISTVGTLGVSMPIIRQMAKEIGRDHSLAEKLWASGIHEACILAALIDVPKMVSEKQMERWVLDIDSWDICDQLCGNLFDKTPYAYDKAVEWTSRDETFVKRAGFVLITQLAVHDKKASDERFVPFLPIIIAGSTDDRNFVKKAVNWALRQIGKRSLYLNELAIQTAVEIRQMDSRSARWIASDALRELTSDAIKDRLHAKDAR